MKIHRPFPQSTLWVWVTVSLLAVNIVLAWAQTEKPAAPKTWNYTALAKVPAKARARRNPLETDPDAVTAGSKLFHEHCAECHGNDAGGAKRGPSLRAITAQRATPGELFYVLSNGVVRHGMPDWSKLPEPERWQIVSFLKSLRE